MGKYKIADFIVEFSPKYNNLKSLSASFEYKGCRAADFVLNVTEEHLKSLYAKMNDGTTIEQAEEFAYANLFNKSIIKHNAMLIHSSAIVYDGEAYLFAGRSGVGKSTHTKFWHLAFGNKVSILNDDKPVVRIYDDYCVAFGTPFDGGSGIANNLSAPLKAVIFIERGEENMIRKADYNEIISNLYQSTAHHLSKPSALAMLDNFDRLIPKCKFYILKCNTDISAAYTAFDTLISD